MVTDAQLLQLKIFIDSTKDCSLAEGLTVLDWLKEEVLTVKQDAVKDTEKQILSLLENRIAARKELAAFNAELPDTDEFTEKVANLLNVQAIPKTPARQQASFLLEEAAVVYEDQAQPEAFAGMVSIRYDEEHGYVLQATATKDGILAPPNHNKSLTFQPKDVSKIQLWEREDDIGWLTLYFRGSSLSFIDLWFKRDADVYELAENLEAQTGKRIEI